MSRNYCIAIVAYLLLGSGLVQGNAADKTVDFTNPANSQVKFYQQGMALEIPLKFLMQGETRHRLTALLPEEGRFDVVMNHAGQVKLENVSTKGGPAGKGSVGVAEFVLQLKRLSPEQARRQAEQKLLSFLPAELKQAQRERQKKKSPELAAYLDRKQIRAPKDDAKLHALYDKVRASEIGRGTLERKLKEFTQQRPEWFVKSDIESLEGIAAIQAMRAYEELLALEVAEPYLREMGLEFEVGPRNYREVIWGHLNGIDALLSGGSSEEKQKGLRSLPQDIREQLRRAISVDASLRFYPATDPTDPNSQWFLAQKVQCAIRGIRSVRVEGNLDPSQGDKSDWWVLHGFDRNKLDTTWPREASIRYELFEEGAEWVKLRLVATSAEATDYALEFTPKAAGKASRTVIITESPTRADAKFPF